MRAAQLHLRTAGSRRETRWAAAPVLLFWATAAKGFNTHIRFRWLVSPRHLFDGVASAYFLFFDVCLANSRPIPGPRHALPPLAVSFSLVTLATIVWELLEFPCDLCLGSHLMLGVTDTSSGPLFGLLGAPCLVCVRLVGSSSLPLAHEA